VDGKLGLNLHTYPSYREQTVEKFDMVITVGNTLNVGIFHQMIHILIAYDLTFANAIVIMTCSSCLRYLFGKHLYAMEAMLVLEVESRCVRSFGGVRWQLGFPAVVLKTRNLCLKHVETRKDGFRLVRSREFFIQNFEKGEPLSGH
jgi:hypothetical protein